jgi:NAD(P)-dependent dehydrogenase (short-subunit alcohol dehydrogenase family)
MFSEIDAQYGRAPWGLVCSAGIAPATPFFETTVEDFDKVMAINVRGIKGDNTWRL